MGACYQRCSTLRQTDPDAGLRFALHLLRRVACWDLGSMQLVRSFAVGREAHAGAKRVEVFNVSSLQAHPVVDGVFVVRV
jgi:hypothetical protein